jgi:hypothetical protein
MRTTLAKLNTPTHVANFKEAAYWLAREQRAEGRGQRAESNSDL